MGKDNEELAKIGEELSIRDMKIVLNNLESKTNLLGQFLFANYRKTLEKEIEGLFESYEIAKSYLERGKLDIEPYKKEFKKLKEKYENFKI